MLPVPVPWRRVTGLTPTTCFRCLGAEHAAGAMVTPASRAAYHAQPEEGLLSGYLFFSPSVDLSEAMDIFEAGVPDVDDDHIEVDVFADSASGFSRPRASTATVIPRRSHAGWRIYSARRGMPGAPPGSASLSGRRIAS